MTPELRKELIYECVDVMYTAMMCGASLLRAATFVSETYYPGGKLTDPGGYYGSASRMPQGKWRELRSRILERDAFVCTYCEEVGDDQSLCVDHIVPLSRGGTNADENLCACCRPCNSSKSDWLLSEWAGRRQ